VLLHRRSAIRLFFSSAAAIHPRIPLSCRCSFPIPFAASCQPPHVCVVHVVSWVVTSIVVHIVRNLNTALCHASRSIKRRHAQPNLNHHNHHPLHPPRLIQRHHHLHHRLQHQLLRSHHHLLLLPHRLQSLQSHPPILTQQHLSLSLLLLLRHQLPLPMPMPQPLLAYPSRCRSWFIHAIWSVSLVPPRSSMPYLPMLFVDSYDGLMEAMQRMDGRVSRHSVEAVWPRIMQHKWVDEWIQRMNNDWRHWRSIGNSIQILNNLYRMYSTLSTGKTSMSRINQPRVEGCLTARCRIVNVIVSSRNIWHSRL